ncbi:hypothetical protein [Hyphomicrobium sp. 1Nfss2.1]
MRRVFEAAYCIGALIVWLIIVYPAQCFWRWLHDETEEDGSGD